MSQRSRGACSALRISRISEASLGSWSRLTLTSSSEFWTGIYTDAIDRFSDNNSWIATNPKTQCGTLISKGFRG